MQEMQETQVRPWVRKEMATRSRILAWKIPWDSGAWWAIVHGVAKNQTQLSNWAGTHASGEDSVLSLRRAGSVPGWGTKILQFPVQVQNNPPTQNQIVCVSKDKIQAFKQKLEFLEDLHPSPWTGQLPHKLKLCSVFYNNPFRKKIEEEQKNVYVKLFLN